MSHTIYEPTLRHAGGEVVWAAEPLWSLDSSRWNGPLELEMTLRKYPGSAPAVQVRLRLDENWFRIDADTEGPIWDLNRCLESKIP